MKHSHLWEKELIMRISHNIWGGGGQQAGLIFSRGPRFMNDQSDFRAARNQSVWGQEDFLNVGGEENLREVLKFVVKPVLFHI